MFVVFLSSHLHIFPGLEGPEVATANLAGLAFSCLLLGTVHALWPHCTGPTSRGRRVLFLGLPAELLPNSLWKASLWNFSAFCLHYQTIDCLSKQGCLTFALQGIPGAHIPPWIWAAWLRLDTTFSTAVVSQSHGVFQFGKALRRLFSQLPHFFFHSQNHQIGVVWELSLAPLLLTSCVTLSPTTQG